MPPANRPQTDDTDETPAKTFRLMVRLGAPGEAEDLVVPTVSQLTLKERFAIRNATGLAPEVFWQISAADLSNLGRDRLAIWLWVAQARANGSNGSGLPPFSMFEQMLDAAADEGTPLHAWIDTPDDETETEANGDSAGPKPKKAKRAAKKSATETAGDDPEG